MEPIHIKITAKKQWQKPDFYLLDSAHDVNASKAEARLHENTVHRSLIPAAGNFYWVKSGADVNDPHVVGVRNQSSAFS